MSALRQTQWPLLFDGVIDIMRHCQHVHGITPNWSFGGGTALMLRIHHRESHDIDIFLDDPQVLPFLNPETQGYALSRRPNAYEADGTHVLKLVYRDVGEIDFICCSAIVDSPFEQRDVRGHRVALETAAEIIAKKVYFRGASFQPRDMFDLAAVAEHYGTEYATEALRQCGTDRCTAALATVQRARPAFVASIIGQLMHRQKTRHLVAHAQEISRRILEMAIATPQGR